MAFLEMRNLSVDFPTANGTFRAVNGLDLSLQEGEVFGIVGESGSGKSVTMLALMGLLPRNARITADQLTFNGVDLLTLPKKQRRQLFGREIAMIFQEPMTSLNPCFSVGFQMIEALRRNMNGSKRALETAATELLAKVGIPDPERRMRSYPHQMSGGMCQRVMIAMALAGNPRLLIADEPTTALDVTLQAEILKLLSSLQQENAMTLVLITHDMGVVFETADRVMVMYASQQVEEQPTRSLFEQPRHPYTAALLEGLPERNRDKRRLSVIPGNVPGAFDRLNGCVFAPRCRFSRAKCTIERPPLALSAAGGLRCHFPLEGE
ncbi:MAG: ABC transporter ATP-binding protein [Brucellaceae bacterium]|jgi:dipeptide transport system ATP-binding protein|nr:ABC transporter ATP-binding protein [Brucellaceae bacterium]